MLTQQRCKEREMRNDHSNPRGGFVCVVAFFFVCFLHSNKKGPMLSLFGIC